MPELLYLLPTLGAIIGVLSILMATYCLWRKIEKDKAEMIQKLSQKFDSQELQGDLHEILDDKLEGFIDDLRNQIPMGSMLFTSALSKTVKGLAKEGFLKMVPDIKDRLLRRLSDDMQLETIILNRLRPELYRLIIYAGLLGFVMGLLSLIFFYFYNG